MQFGKSDLGRILVKQVQLSMESLFLHGSKAIDNFKGSNYRGDDIE